MVKGNGISPSDVCLQSFQENFEGAVNVEWFNRTDSYEAIFYKNNLEYIAIFSLTGFLMEYKQSLSLDYLPEAIKKIALSKGEIMNSVIRNKGNTLEYELIVRDKQQDRHLLVLSDAGFINEQKKL
jgi:hypothetical protein